MSQINHNSEKTAKNRFGEQYLGPLHPLESDVWQSSNIFAFPNKQDEYVLLLCCLVVCFLFCPVGR
jgi:hypothetical protein